MPTSFDEVNARMWQHLLDPIHCFADGDSLVEVSYNEECRRSKTVQVRVQAWALFTNDGEISQCLRKRTKAHRVLPPILNNVPMRSLHDFLQPRLEDHHAWE